MVKPDVPSETVDVKVKISPTVKEVLSGVMVNDAGATVGAGVGDGVGFTTMSGVFWDCIQYAAATTPATKAAATTPIIKYPISFWFI